MSDPNSSGEQPKASGVAIAVASPAANESNKEWDVNDGKNMGIASKSSLSLAVSFVNPRGRHLTR